MHSKLSRNEIREMLRVKAPKIYAIVAAHDKKDDPIPRPPVVEKAKEVEKIPAIPVKQTETKQVQQVPEDLPF